MTLLRKNVGSIRVPVLIVAALVLSACSDTAGIEPDTGGNTLEGVSPTAASTSTFAPATTAAIAVEESLADGIWIAELGAAVLQFRLSAGAGGTTTGVFDSPAEGVTDLPVVVNVAGEDVEIEIPVAGATFTGIIRGDSMDGVWRQAGSEITVSFSRRDTPFAYSRPQEPTPPFPYEAADVSFGDDVTLAGTLTIPNGAGPFPGAVLISGSGQQDRDETLLGHKPFLVLADHLARAGIATLRYDDRGVGESMGNPIGATTEDFAEDAAHAAEFLAEHDDITTVGLIGHSEGGLIGPMVAGSTDSVAFVVLLAAPGLPGADVLARQTEDLLRAEGAPQSIVDWQAGWTRRVIDVAATTADIAGVEEQIRSIMATAAENAPPGMEATVGPQGIDGIVAAYTDPWMRYFLAYDPRPALRSLEVPVLAMTGSLDLQVSAAENLPEIELAVTGNSDATVVELAGLNHLFQTAVTGAVSEYASIEETMSPDALELVAAWITDRF